MENLVFLSLMSRHLIPSNEVRENWCYEAVQNFAAMGALRTPVIENCLRGTRWGHEIREAVKP
jgi:hypothetical protein